MTARQIVCSHCGQKNRLPPEKPAAEARCGKCREPFFTGHALEVDEAGFERQIAFSEVPLLVDVWAPWCGPCRMMAPAFEAAAERLEPRFRLLKFNSDTAPTVSARLEIRSIPTLLLASGGRVVARTAGAMNTSRIVEWAEANLASTR